MASEQEAQERLEQFFHHDKKDHPPTDREFGKTPARDSGTRQEEHKAKRREEAGAATHPLNQSLERRKKDALKQADQYGQDLSQAQTYPQTLLDEQNTFGGSRNTESKDPVHGNKLSVVNNK